MKYIIAITIATAIALYLARDSVGMAVAQFIIWFILHGIKHLIFV